jgi:hypothetical protein
MKGEKKDMVINNKIPSEGIIKKAVLAASYKSSFRLINAESNPILLNKPKALIAAKARAKRPKIEGFKIRAKIIVVRTEMSFTTKLAPTSHLIPEIVCFFRLVIFYFREKNWL